MGERENGRARGRQARGEGAPARKAHENHFNSEVWIFPIGREALEGKSYRAGRENCQAIVHGQCSEGLIGTDHYKSYGGGEEFLSRRNFLSLSNSL